MALSKNNNHTFVSGELVTSAKLNSTKHIQTDTEANNDLFTGNPGQLTYDSTNKKLRLHDGTTAGGLEVNPTQGGVSLGAGSVNTSALADGAVTEVKLANGSVTSDKLATGAVSLGVGAVTEAMLGAGAVTQSKLEDTGVTAGDYDMPNISVDAKGRITSATASSFAGSISGVRAILHCTRNPAQGAFFETKPWSLGSRSQNVASVTFPPPLNSTTNSQQSSTARNGIRFVLDFDLTDAIVIAPASGKGTFSTASGVIFKAVSTSISQSGRNIDIDFVTDSGTSSNVTNNYLEWFGLVF